MASSKEVEDQHSRGAALGSVDSGKSSTLGYLANGILDDGKGKARNTVAKHPHERETGRTSDISNVALIREIEVGKGSDKRVVRKIVTLSDQCGHEGYLKTTLWGTFALRPHFNMICVASNRGVLAMTNEHLGITHAMRKPFFILYTKVDYCWSDTIQNEKLFKLNLNSIGKKLVKLGKKPVLINDLDTLKLFVEIESMQGKGYTAYLDLLRQHRMNKIKSDKFNKELKSLMVEYKYSKEQFNRFNEKLKIFNELQTQYDEDEISKEKYLEKAKDISKEHCFDHLKYHELTEKFDNLKKKHLKKFLHYIKTMSKNKDYNKIPILCTCNRNGYYLDVLEEALLSFEGKSPWKEDKEDHGTIYYIDTIFNVKGVGSVVSGIMKGTTISLLQDKKKRKQLYMGPFGNNYYPIEVKSMHNEIREDIKELNHGEAGCLAFRFTKETPTEPLRKGMVVISDLDYAKEHTCWQFVAETVIAHHPTSISTGYCAKAHIGSAREDVRFKILKNKSNEKSKTMATGEVGIIQYHCTRRPIFIESGACCAFRESTAHAFGWIEHIIKHDNIQFRKHGLKKSKKKEIEIL